MTLEVLPYSQEHEELWDSFCANAINSTLLHTRRFLSYHGDRFQDQSLLIMETGKLIGAFPAATSLSNEKIVSSHPGVTYGGLLHKGRLTGMRMLEALTAVVKYYANVGFSELEYKVIPHIYTVTPAQDDLYALFRLGAQRTRCDLSCTIDLANRLPMSERRRRSLKKAKKEIIISNDPTLMPELWEVVTQNLARKHGAIPVHSLDELSLLIERFPDQILIRCALIDGKVEAGIVLFNSANVWHAQYIAASELAYQVSALDAIFDAAIIEALEIGIRYFDFGTSNEDSGRVLNDGLYRFKSEFGGAGVTHDFFSLDLSKI